MYNALVSPHFNYCSTVWHVGDNSNIDNLFKLQKCAARVITGSTFEIQSVEIFNNFRWSSVINSLNTLFNICDNKYYNLRSNNTNLTLNKPKTNFLKRSFSYRGAVCWNRLDQNIVNNINNKTLKQSKISYATSE